MCVREGLWRRSLVHQLRGGALGRAAHRVFEAVLLLVDPRQVEPGVVETRRPFERAQQQPFGPAPALRLARDLGQQAQRVDLVGPARQQFAADALAFLHAPLPQVLAGLSQPAAVRRQAEGLLENGVGLLPRAEARQRMAQLHAHRLRARVQPGRFLQLLDGLGQPAGLHQRLAVVLARPGEARRPLHRALQRLQRVARPAAGQQRHAAQGQQVHVVGRGKQRRAANGRSGGGIAAVQQVHGPLEFPFQGSAVGR